MSTERLSGPADVITSSEASGAINMADAIIRFLDGQISVVSNYVAEEAYKKIKKEVIALKQHATEGNVAKIKACHTY